MKRGTREYTFWSIGLFVIVAASLFPVLWIASLSLKEPATIADGRVFPTEWTFDNYKSLFEGGLDSPLLRPLINSIVIALIATTIAIVLASFTAYAIARLEFPGKLLILGGALAIAMFPPISTVGPLFDMWRNARALRHLGRPDHPLPDLLAAAGDLHARRLLPRDPVGTSSRRRRSTGRRRCRRSAR